MTKRFSICHTNPHGNHPKWTRAKQLSTLHFENTWNLWKLARPEQKSLLHKLTANMFFHRIPTFSPIACFSVSSMLRFSLIGLIGPHVVQHQLSLSRDSSDSRSNRWNRTSLTAAPRHRPPSRRKRSPAWRSRDRWWRSLGPWPKQPFPWHRGVHPLEQDLSELLVYRLDSTAWLTYLPYSMVWIGWMWCCSDIQIWMEH